MIVPPVGDSNINFGQEELAAYERLFEAHKTMPGLIDQTVASAY